MTPDLEQRWKQAQMPFDGKIVTSGVDSSMQTLLKALEYFTKLLDANPQNFYLYHDWHEHDGYLTQAKPISSIKLKNMVANEQSLRASMNGEAEVRTAVYPQSNEWLMRWYIDPDDSAYCDFEFCIATTAKNNPLEQMYLINPQGLNQLAAKTYFDKSYGG